MGLYELRPAAHAACACRSQAGSARGRLAGYGPDMHIKKTDDPNLAIMPIMHFQT